MKEFGIQVITVYPQLITRAFIEANIRVRTPTAKKIAGLFQDFQGPFSPFSRPKFTNRPQIFIATTCSELCLGTWLKGNNLDKFCSEIPEFALTILTIFNYISSGKKTLVYSCY